MGIREIFLRNFWWKLASVVLATLIWVNYVYRPDRMPLTEKHTLSRHLTVVPLAHNADVSRFKTDPLTVTVNLEGQTEQLAYLDEAEIRAHVLLDNPAHTNGVRLKVWVRGLPSGISLHSIVPDKVRIYTEPAH